MHGRATLQALAQQTFNSLAAFSNCARLCIMRCGVFTLFPLIFTILSLIPSNFRINIISYKINKKSNKYPRNKHINEGTNYDILGLNIDAVN